MWKFLTLFSEWLMKGSVKSILAGAGLGLGSALVTLTAVQAYIAEIVQTTNGFQSEVLALCALSGAHIALSSIFGAIVYKVTVGGAKLSLIRKSL